jgi:hypothetical protein
MRRNAALQKELDVLNKSTPAASGGQLTHAAVSGKTPSKSSVRNKMIAQGALSLFLMLPWGSNQREEAAELSTTESIAETQEPEAGEIKFRQKADEPKSTAPEPIAKSGAEQSAGILSEMKSFFKRS